MYLSFPQSLKKLADFKGKCDFFFFKMGNWPLLNVPKKYIFFLTFFRHVLTILAWTKCRPNVTKHALLSHIFLHTFFGFSINILFIRKNLNLSNKDNSILNYTFIGMIIFWRSIHLSFQSHQMWAFSNGVESGRTVLYFIQV